MTYVRTEDIEPGIRVVTLEKPERLNAIDFDGVRELHAALDAIAADRTCRVVILTGAGRGFCAGLDLKAFGGFGAFVKDPEDPAESQAIELLLAHSAGYVELFYGYPLNQSSWELATDALARSSLRQALAPVSPGLDVLAGPYQELTPGSVPPRSVSRLSL